MYGFEWFPEYISSLRSQGSTQEQGLWTTTTVGRLAVYESTMKNRQHAASFTAQSLPASIAAGWGSPFQPWSWGHCERLLQSIFAAERFRDALRPCGFCLASAWQDFTVGVGDRVAQLILEHLGLQEYWCELFPLASTFGGWLRCDLPIQSNSIVYRRKIWSQTSDNMDRWKAEQGRGREKRESRREKIREEKESEESRCRCAKR